MSERKAIELLREVREAHKGQNRWSQDAWEHLDEDIDALLAAHDAAPDPVRERLESVQAATGTLLAAVHAARKLRGRIGFAYIDQQAVFTFIKEWDTAIDDALNAAISEYAQQQAPS